MTDAGTPRTPGRGLRIALMASLALNVLIIGAVAGTLLASRHYGWKARSHKGFGLTSFSRTLPAERGEAIRARIAERKATFRSLRKTEREAREAARGLLVVEPFDQGQFDAALKRAADADAEIARAQMSLLSETVAELTPEERRRLHDWFASRKRGRSKK